MNYPEPVEGLPIVCMDFDGVLAKDTWPSPFLGEPIPSGIEAVVHYSTGGNEVVIYTARPESHKARIWAWLDDVGLAGAVYDVVCGKPRAGLYVDDRAWNPVTDRWYADEWVTRQLGSVNG